MESDAQELQVGGELSELARMPRLDELLTLLERVPREILEHIERDPDLLRRERGDGLVIANASQSLLTPQRLHQLYAKGLVYERNPLHVVSVPLLKLYNHGESDRVDRLTERLDRRAGVRVVAPVKEDGFLGQIFAHGGRVHIATRGMLEGIHEAGDESVPHVAIMRELVERQHPQLLDAGLVGDRTLHFEVIDPRTAQVTRYGERSQLVLISVFDGGGYRYWTHDELDGWAREHGLRPVSIRGESDELQGALARVEELDGASRIPEGVVASFETDAEIVHRVKCKTADWHRHFRALYRVDQTEVSRALWHEPRLRGWEVYRRHLLEEGRLQEEFLDAYRGFFDAHMAWLERCEERVERARRRLREVLAEIEADDDIAPDERTRQLAATVRERWPEEMRAIMRYHRYGDDDELLYDIMWADPIVTQVREWVLEARGRR
jgi:hypothetical protein